MSKTAKIIAGVVVIVIIVLLIVSGGKKSESGPIKIGVIMPLSGDLAFLGEPGKKAAELALENFPNKKNKYELVFEDDQFNAVKAATAANKLISVDKVQAILTFGSSGGNVVNPLAEKNKIIHFGVASDPHVADGNFNFNHWTPPAEEVRALVAELKKRNITKIAIVTPNQAGMKAITDELKNQVKDTNIQVVNEQIHNIGDKDFRSLITKLNEGKPELVVLTSYSPELEILAKQMKDIGFKTPLTSIEGFDQTSEPALFDGYWYASASDPTGEFTKMFSEKTGANVAFGTGNAYDIISLLVTGFENVGSSDTDKVVSELYKIEDFKGAMGNLSIDNNGLVLSTATIKTVSAKK